MFLSLNPSLLSLCNTGFTGPPTYRVCALQVALMVELVPCTVFRARLLCTVSCASGTSGSMSATESACRRVPLGWIRQNAPSSCRRMWTSCRSACIKCPWSQLGWEHTSGDLAPILYIKEQHSVKNSRSQRKQKTDRKAIALYHKTSGKHELKDD